MEPPRILAISGSLRTGSYNRKALRIAIRIAQDLGARAEEIELRELNLPIYDGDIEAKGIPESVQKLKKAVEAADVLLIASPEYNYSVSGALKNAIDWLSRDGNSLDGKVAAIFGVSSGKFGTQRGQFHLRQILQALNVLVPPQPQVLIGPADEVFTDDNSFRDQKIYEQLTLLVTRALDLARRLR